MPKSLERDLGLFATLTISIGAMVGSGIFVLPGLAAGKAGPAAILAYLLAGLIVLPAALSKAEMATAIPESGGTYLYIDRAMGPLPGTVAGIGAWFSLVFKSAFALVGLGAYLLLFAPIPDSLLVFVSLGLGVLLVAVNVSGAKLTGRLQVVVVSCVLLVLVGFVGDGLTYVSHARYHPFFTHGADGLFAATGLVFVSYAGVTKIASVAEEVEDPGRNIPIAILASVLLMMVVYTLTVFVVLGVVPVSALAHDLTPMTTAASAFAGRFGEVVVAVVAVLALTSMANAGVLSSSRYPLAMSRDSLAPPIAGRVSERFKTPVVSIAFTGAILLCLIAFVPVIDLAKLASAFQILVFALVNVALIAFRESSLDWYDPAFRAPGYPFVQVAGFVASALLLTQMGWLPLAGAAGIVALGALWYRVYGRARTTREGAAMETLRETAAVDGAPVTDAALAAPDGDVLVALGEHSSVARERALLALAADVAAGSGATVYAVRFESVPEQLTLSSATEMDASDRELEADVGRFAAGLPAPVEARTVVSHNAPRAVVNAAADLDAGLLVGAWRSADLTDREHDVDWYLSRAPCDVAFVRDRGVADLEEVAVLVEPAVDDFAPARTAFALAASADARARLVTALDSDADESVRSATRALHDDLAARAPVPVARTVLESDDHVAGLADATASSSLVVAGVAARSSPHQALFGDRAVELVARSPASVLLVHGRAAARRTVFRSLVRWLLGR